MIIIVIIIMIIIIVVIIIIIIVHITLPYYFEHVGRQTTYIVRQFECLLLSAKELGKK